MTMLGITLEEEEIYSNILHSWNLLNPSYGGDYVQK